MKSALSDIFKDFTKSEKNAGIILLLCVGISIFLSNTSYSDTYIHFWHHKTGFWLLNYDLRFSIEHWINDGLMTVFFLMVGLEIERELYNGELNPLKNAILPITGAIGGMLVPALIFSLMNFSSDTSKGFGIPMGTDIAFALGILSLAGDKVPVSLKILLTAIAIIDDLGSILIIALFYGNNIQLGYLGASLAIFGVLLILNRLKVYNVIPYIILAFPMWFFMMQSGIHPTISGVLLAFAFPFGDGSGKSPSIVLQHKLHTPVAFIILPLFTLANTAIPIKTEFVSGLSNQHALGIGLGLVLGKPIGIMAGSWLAVKTKIVKLPATITWYNLLCMGFLGGIGFTMSIFITQLAFNSEFLIQSSKLMILLSSAIAGVTGYLLFQLSPRRKIKSAQHKPT